MTINFIMESDSFHDRFNTLSSITPSPLSVISTLLLSLHCPLPLFLSHSSTRQLVSLQSWTSRQTPMVTLVRGPPLGPRATVLSGQGRRRTARSDIPSPLSPCPTNPCQLLLPSATPWKSAGRSSSAPVTPQQRPELERSAGDFPAAHLHR